MKPITNEIQLKLRISAAPESKQLAIWVENLAEGSSAVRFDSIEYLVRYLKAFSTSSGGLK